MMKMATKEEIREIIAGIVREEIKALAEETNSIIIEIVREELVPGLRSAIRESIAKELGCSASGEHVLPGGHSISECHPLSEYNSIEEHLMLSESVRSDKHDLFDKPALTQDYAVPCRHTDREKEAAFEQITKEDNDAIASSEEFTPHVTSDEETERVADASSDQGLYLYGLTDTSASTSLGNIGIDGCEVYTIPHEGIAAIVHNSPLEPYKSDDNEAVKAWVKQHQRVMDAAAERFGNIMPFGFDTIIAPKDCANAKEELERWLSDEHEELLRKMERIKGKKEYGVQIFYVPSAFGKRIEESPEIKRIKEEMASKPPGLAYMYKQKLEDAVKTELNSLMDAYFNDFYEKIKMHSDDIKVEKVKKADDGTVMMMNLSLLATDEKSLGQALDEIEGEEGITVHFTGPWQPYSFI